MTEFPPSKTEITLVKLQNVRTIPARCHSAKSVQSLPASLSILEPIRKKIATVEAQRVLECLDECIRRAELAASLFFILLMKDAKLEQFSNVLDPEVVSAVKLHKILCQSLDTAVIEKDTERLLMLHVHLSHSCKSILRMLKEDPVVGLSIRRELPESCSHHRDTQLHQAIKLILALKELRLLLLERLLTTPYEISNRLYYFIFLRKQEKKNNTLIDLLKSKLLAATEDKVKALDEKDVIIMKLKADIHIIKNASDENTRRTKGDLGKIQSSDSRNSEVKQLRSKLEADKIREQWQKVLLENREEEQHLRKKKFKIETEVENWIAKYDQDMGEKQEEYEEIDKHYDDEKDQLSELQEKFDILREEYDGILEKRRRLLEEKRAREYDLKRRNEAARIIQASYRGHKVRKALKIAYKKKNKKGKKGKGRKKKKK